MPVRRRRALVAAVGIIALSGVWPTAPAAGHGAPTTPASRAFACRPDGGDPAQAACAAALAANGGPFGVWDNLRVPGVAGRDREVIPDGKLCSAGKPEFQGLDLARADWPSTTVPAGSVLQMRYTATIAHRGTFRVYLTRAGYDPAQPLRWDSLDPQPFLTATDPALTGGAYALTGTLPAGRTGRHVLYTVWQNSDTPDTYYSCSDVVLDVAGPAGGASPPAAGPSAVPTGGRSPAAVPTPPGRSPTVKARRGVVPAPGSSPQPAPGPGAVLPPPPPDGARTGVEPEPWTTVAEPLAADRVALGQQIMSAALIVIFGVTAGLAFQRIRAERAQRTQGGPGRR